MRRTTSALGTLAVVGLLATGGGPAEAEEGAEGCGCS